jgi:SAM-dependent methyltransferase
VPSLEWNRKWGSDVSRHLRKGERSHYGDEWGDPGASALRRWLGTLTGKGRFRSLHLVARRYIEPFVGPDKVCLEIGPGGGRWTQFLVGARELILVDLNPEFFEYLRRRFPEAAPRMRFYETSGYELGGVADGSVDFVFSFGTFVHIEPEGIDAYLGELRRVLRPGGIASLQYADKTKWPAARNPNFSNMTPDRMEALATARGFRLRAHDTALLLHSSIAVLER